MSKTAAKDTKFKVGTDVVGSLTSISGVKLSANTIDVTTLDNADGYKEYLGSFKDGNEVSISGFYDYTDDGQGALYTAFESGAATSFTIEFPAGIGAKWTFDGVVTAYETSAEIGGAITFDCTIKVSGKPTLAAIS